MPRYGITLKTASGEKIYTVGRADNEWKMRARVSTKYPNGTIIKVEKIGD